MCVLVSGNNVLVRALLSTGYKAGMSFSILLLPFQEQHAFIPYGYAAVASRRLRLSTVCYGHLRLTTEEMKFLNMLKIAPRKKTRRRKRDG